MLCKQSAPRTLSAEMLLEPEWAGSPKYCCWRAEAPGLQDGSRDKKKGTHSACSEGRA